jgi:hypothetical protein
MIPRLIQRMSTGRKGALRWCERKSSHRELGMVDDTTPEPLIDCAFSIYREGIYNPLPWNRLGSNVIMISLFCLHACERE